MSNTEGSAGQAEISALRELEAALGRLIQELTLTRGRASEAEAKSAELAEIVKRFTGDEGEAGRLLTRLQSLEAENADLRARFDRGRQGVERLLARIKFLEEQR